ncbi:uncharacterized protein N7469_003534 [Penicillium citrinum]|uniref:Uncharacterized protein n=2 Tax=Penicillium TaxID=5073 RepID=A0A9W9TPN8_PENCI|nr:uncharacterized protein N7469_003534 [Penicillium citrinum]KAJ5234366.1 hypothetical protein N7469_003534 [Penicillium citrinum]KAJ5589987.1 hypothetical protein N7450_003959 [Penicillium hetheringtonii]
MDLGGWKCKKDQAGDRQDHACIRNKQQRTYGQVLRIATVELLARLVAPWKIGNLQPGRRKLGGQPPGAETSGRNRKA